MAKHFNPKFRVKFLRSSTVENTPVDEGNFIAKPEDGELLLDMDGENRVVVGNLQFVDTLAELGNITKPLKKMYFCKEDNCGYVYDFDNLVWKAVVTNFPQWQTLR